jgi:hypothetical protein
MPKLLTAFIATILIASCGIWKAEAATTIGTLAPLTKNYSAIEKVGYWRRCVRRGYCGYAYPYYYRPYPYYYRPYAYYGYGPYYRYRWRY